MALWFPPPAEMHLQTRKRRAGYRTDSRGTAAEGAERSGPKPSGGSGAGQGEQPHCSAKTAAKKAYRENTLQKLHFQDWKMDQPFPKLAVLEGAGPWKAPGPDGVCQLRDLACAWGTWEGDIPRPVCPDQTGQHHIIR